MPPFGRLISALLLLAAACLLDRSSKLLTMAPPTSSAPACSGSQEQNKKEKQWDGSEAKKLVYQYLKAGTIPCDGSIPPSVIWRTHFKDHPLFVDCQSYNRFRDRFLSLRNRLTRKGPKTMMQLFYMTGNFIQFHCFSKTKSIEVIPKAIQGGEATRLKHF